MGEISSRKVVMAVSNDFVTDARVYKEAKTLSDAGYQVVVIATKRKSDKLPPEEKVAGFIVKRVELPDKTSGVNYAIERIKQIKQTTKFGRPYFDKFYERLLSEKGNIYHANDADTLLPAYKAAKLNNAKLVYDVHDLYPDMLDALISYHRKNGEYIEWLLILLAKRNYARIEAGYINKVDVLITVNETLAKELINRYNLRKKPVIIYNYPEIPKIKQSNLIREKLGLSNDTKIVLFQGVFHPGRSLKELVEAMQFVDDNIVLVFLGKGKLEEELKNLVNKLSLESRIFFLGEVPYSEVFNYTVSADVGIVALEESAINKKSSPVKIYDYLAAGLSVVATDTPEIRKILPSANILPSTEPEKIASGLKNALSYDKTQKITIVRNWLTEAKKLLGIYGSLLQV